MNESPPAAIPPPPMPIACRKCQRSIGGDDAYCRFCGTRQHVTDPFYYHPLWILVLAFLVLGPFALGLVWKSRAMSPTMKVIMAAIIVVYSAMSVYAGYVIVMAVYKEFQLLNQIM